MILHLTVNNLRSRARELPGTPAIRIWRGKADRAINIEGEEEREIRGGATGSGGKVGVGLSVLRARDPGRHARMKFLALSAMMLAAALLFLGGCGGEEEQSPEEAEETTTVEEVEPTTSREETEVTKDQEETEPAESREETEASEVQETTVAPEPTVAPKEEAVAPTKTAPPAPPPQPEPAGVGVSAAQTAVPGTVPVGQPVTFTIAVKNNVATQRAALKNFLPQGVSFVSATPSQGFCGASHHGGNIVECSLGVIPSGSSATVSVVVTPTVPGAMTSTAVAQAEFAPATPANTASATVTVTPGSLPGIPEAHGGH